MVFPASSIAVAPLALCALAICASDLDVRLTARAAIAKADARAAPGSCFLLHELGAGDVRRNPATTCATRVSPQSTFKVPHALAALDAGVISEEEVVPYDNHPVDFESWRRSHTLPTAMHYSVVWFFQEIARRLGPDRERAYLKRFEYGNQDASSGLTSFWLGGSLAISPEEQQRFLGRLFADELPVKGTATETVRRILVQPSGNIVNALGEHGFAAPWPAGVVVSAKTGSGGTGDGRQVRWLIGHVRRGDRAWIFVSNVIGDATTPATAAVDLAERALVEARVLR